MNRHRNDQSTSPWWNIMNLSQHPPTPRLSFGAAGSCAANHHYQQHQQQQLQLQLQWQQWYHDHHQHHHQHHQQQQQWQQQWQQQHIIVHQQLPQSSLSSNQHNNLDDSISSTDESGQRRRTRSLFSPMVRAVVVAVPMLKPSSFSSTNRDHNFVVNYRGSNSSTTRNSASVNGAATTTTTTSKTSTALLKLADPSQMGKKRRSKNENSKASNKKNKTKQTSKKTSAEGKSNAAVASALKQETLSSTTNIQQLQLASSLLLPLELSSTKNTRENNDKNILGCSISHNKTTTALSMAPLQKGKKRQTMSENEKNKKKKGKTKCNTGATAKLVVDPPKKEKKPRSKTVPWSTQEDEALKRAVEEQHNRNGGQAVTTIDWVVVATQAGLDRHTNMQCRFRWNNNFRPGLKKGDWTLQEHEAIRQMYQTMGPKWAEMAKLMVSRSANDIKNKWYYTVRKDTRLSQIGSSQPHKLDTTAVTTDNFSLSSSHPPAVASAQTATSSTSSVCIDTATITRREAV